MQRALFIEHFGSDLVVAPGPVASRVKGFLAWQARRATEGLLFLANFRLVQEAFENPALAADRAYRQAVLGYLRDDSTSALPFRWLARGGYHPGQPALPAPLKKPSFSWEHNGEALLRKHKPWCFETTPGGERGEGLAAPFAGSGWEAGGGSPRVAGLPGVSGGEDALVAGDQQGDSEQDERCQAHEAVPAAVDVVGGGVFGGAKPRSAPVRRA